MDKTKKLLLAFVVLSGSVWLSSVNAQEVQSYDCVMLPSAVIGVSTAEPGVIDNVLVDRSDKVKKGQLLIKLESSVEEVDHDLAKAQSKMNAVVELRKVSVDYNKRNLERIKSLHKKKMISNELKEKADHEAEAASWRLQDAKDTIVQRELKLRRAEAVLMHRRVYSPVDGIVVEKLHHKGEYVEEKPVLKIAQLNPLFVEVVIPLSEFGNIQPGMKAYVTPEFKLDENSKNGEPLEAIVDVVDGVGDAASGTFGVRLILENKNYEIPAGVKCSVTFNKVDIKVLKDVQPLNVGE